jgi:hypothetical protein
MTRTSRSWRPGCDQTSSRIPFHLAQLRHLYWHFVNGTVIEPEAARWLVAPAIEALEADSQEGHQRSLPHLRLLYSAMVGGQNTNWCKKTQLSRAIEELETEVGQ